MNYLHFVEHTSDGKKTTALSFLSLSLYFAASIPKLAADCISSYLPNQPAQCIECNLLLLHLRKTSQKILSVLNAN